MRDLLTLSTAKTTKGEALGWLTAVLYLPPATSSGRNLCPSSVPQCRAACLANSGRMHMATAHAKRQARADLFLHNRPAFETALISALHSTKRKADRRNLKLAFRPNGTSDLHFHTLLRRWPEVSEIPNAIYDYTKRPSAWSRPYHLTFSYSGSNWPDCHAMLKAGRNVAVVFNLPRGATLPLTFRGFPVLDGDLHDLRFLDPPSHIVGLRYKRIPHHPASDFPTFIQRG